jgi:hypothetical protein
MVERGDGASLALEASETFGIARDRRRQNLERNVATELGVSSSDTSPIPPTPIAALIR